MTPADILKAIGDGGFGIIQFVMIYLLWRELIRSRMQCEGQITGLQETQMRNVSKIARLEAQIELVIATRNDFKSTPTTDQQPIVIQETALKPHN